MSANVADGQLLDVREYSLADLEFADLDTALDRILSSSPGCNFNSFGSSI